jgi:death-on-curing protein
VTRYLDLDLLLAIVDEAGLQAVRDPGLLDSAGHRPRTTVFGENAYPTLDEKAAVLLESIVRNHPLIDGNERLGWLSAVILYRLNGVVLDAPEDPAYELVIGIAEGRVDYHESAATLASWTSTST